MLRKATEAGLYKIIREAHPHWNDEASRIIVKNNVEQFDESLDDLISTYAETGMITFFQHGEFSIFDIIMIRDNCSFYDAVELIDAYIKDEVDGKLRIIE